MKANFESIPVGSKIEVLDSFGYPVIELCGIVVSHIGDGHAVVKNFSGFHFSTVGFESKAHSIELYN